MKHDCIFTIRLLMLRPIMTQTNYPSSPFPPPPIHQSKNRKQHIAYLFCSDLSTRISFTPPLSPHISRSTSSLLVSLTATTLTEAALMHLPPLIPIHPLTPKKIGTPVVCIHDRYTWVPHATSTRHPHPLNRNFFPDPDIVRN